MSVFVYLFDKLSNNKDLSIQNDIVKFNLALNATR